MTKKEKAILKQNAQKAMRENGLKAFQKDMILLECGYGYEEVCGLKIMEVTYVMFEDSKTGKQFQCFYGPNYYNPDLKTLWYVQEYIA